MSDNKFFSIEKCEPQSARRIMLWTAGIITGGILLTVYSPLEYLFHHFGYKDSNGCPLLTFTGIPCPLCGIGRSFWAIMSLDLKGSFYYNPCGIFFFTISGFILVSVFLLAVFGYRVKVKEGLLKLWYLFAGLIAVVWVLNVLFGHH